MEYVNDLPSLLLALLPWALWCVVWLFAVNWHQQRAPTSGHAGARQP